MEGTRSLFLIYRSSDIHNRLYHNILLTFKQPRDVEIQECERQKNCAVSTFLFEKLDTPKGRRKKQKEKTHMAMY